MAKKTTKGRHAREKNRQQEPPALPEATAARDDLRARKLSKTATESAITDAAVFGLIQRIQEERALACARHQVASLRAAKDGAQQRSGGVVILANPSGDMVGWMTAYGLAVAQREREACMALFRDLASSVIMVAQQVIFDGEHADLERQEYARAALRQLLTVTEERLVRERGPISTADYSVATWMMTFVRGQLVAVMGGADGETVRRIARVVEDTGAATVLVETDSQLEGEAAAEYDVDTPEPASLEVPRAQLRRITEGA